ncbi:hypothetical protein BJ138DRAFT_1161506 [Hygrophoropsis aurantiaca]|uniref:Uncharacterized protein n=1 Tax=Hygrophoropsis aurantiaca TaxID=72124 RepID=A0ACB8A1L8_9AGAM|nr:hypothetical protein BJ138DRAFT_1161506 [Hygrophoropsis aurantiaca]
MHNHHRHLPPVTLRHIFPPERSPSPPSFANITLRKVFELEVLHSHPAPGRIGFGSIRASSAPPHPGTNCSQSPASGMAAIRPLSLCRLGPPKYPNLISADGKELRPGPIAGLSKPNAGGYTLKDALGWNDTTYKIVQDDLRILARQLLDITRPYNEQSSKAQKLFLEAALQKHPGFASYADQWPAQDFATIYLKNTSFMHRAQAKASSVVGGPITT